MQRSWTIPLVYLTSFLFLFGATLQPAPRIAIYENIVCHRYYGATTPPALRDCKIAPVQQELAFLGGIERLSIIIPSVLAIPFAALADRYGHSLVLSIAIFGVFLGDGWPFVVCWFPDVFPIRLIWLQFTFSMVGGGFTVVVTLLHVIIADVVSAEERTTMFFRARAAGVAASILGYAASGLLMKVADFLPWAVGLCSLILGTFTAAMIANTTTTENAKSLDTIADPEIRTLRSMVGPIRGVATLLVGNKQVLAMLVLVFLCQLGFDSVPTMLAIYISKRYGWTFADASFLSSLEMSIELFTLVVLLPALTFGVLSSVQSLSTFSKDKIVAQISLVTLAVGTLCLGFAPVVIVAILGIVVLALGTGQDSLTRSMATDMVQGSDLSTVYSAITMLRAIGGSISGPIYAWLYSVALRDHGESWLGLPYIIAGSLFIVAFVLLTVIKDPQEDKKSILEPDREPLLG
ncbi:hypothetical protein ACN47E_002132 [Coniothyrium glycines]